MAERTAAGLSWRTKVGLAIARKAATFAGKTFTMSDSGDQWAFDRGTYTGKTVNERTAMQVSTVWACNRVLAEGRGQLPVHIMERDRRTGNLTRVDHDLGSVLVDAPNAEMTSQEFAEARMLNLGMRGNGYSRITRNASRTRIESLYPLKSTNVRAKRRVDGQVLDASSYSGGDLFYQVNDRGRWEDVPAEDIWHQRIFSMDGVNGLSPIAYARETMAFSMGLEEFGARLFGQGLHVGSIFKTPKWLTSEQRTAAYERLERYHSRLVNTGKVYIAEGGVEPVESGMLPPEDAQFLELRGFEVDDICRFYLVPPHRVARLEKMTNNNIEQLSLEFVMYTLLPYIVKEESSADRWLFNARDRGRFVVRCNYDGLLRGDSEARSKLHSVLLQNGAQTRNEVRALENLPRSDQPGMDKFTVQSNMISVDDLKAVADAMRGNAGAN